MLAERPVETQRVACRSLLVGIALLLVASLFATLARADRPTLIDNNDGSRTVSWSLTSSENLTLAGIDLATGNATLPWRPHNVSWAASQFADNGTTPDANLTFGSDGISLRPDASNHVADGDFTTATPWTYENSQGGNVTAQWNGTIGAAQLRHDSPPSERLWDGFNSTTGWVGIGGTTWLNTTGKREGTAMLGLNFSLPPGPKTFAGVQHLVAVNWSAYDRMIVWVLLLNSTPPLTFNISAFEGATSHGTREHPLSPGWNEIIANLSELGPTRDSLVSLTLRLNGQSVPMTTAYFDDLRVGTAKRFDEASRIVQPLFKANATSASPGSASLRFNWSLPAAAGIVRATGTVNLTGPSGAFERTFERAPASQWTVVVADVSPMSIGRGWYNLSFSLEVVANNTSASSVDMRIDDVSLFFPNRHNGTYLSAPVSLGTASDFLRVNWSLDAPAPASAQLSLRSGNDSNPSGSAWSSWVSWTGSGPYPLTIPGALYVQVRAVLMTANSSVTPVLRGMTLETRHRAAQGSVVSGLFTVPTDRPFLRWRTFTSADTGPAGTVIRFSISNGGFWKPVPLGGDISGTSWTSIQWSADFTTSDGLATPKLQRVDLVYDLVGPVPEIPYLSYGLGVLAAVVLGTAGYGVVIRRRFAVEDVFLVSKEGRLLMHNTRRMRADRDEDILSAMLTAILTFLKDFDREENAGLRRFQVGGKTALLERGEHAYLAAVYSGRVPRWAGKDLRRFMNDLEARFGERFARWSGDPDDLQGLKEFSERFVTRFRYRSFPLGKRGAR